MIDAGVTVISAPFSGQCQMLFEDENVVMQATALPQVSPCVEAWLSISQSGALHFVRQCGVGSLVVAWSPQQVRASPSILKVKRSALRAGLRMLISHCALRSKIWLSGQSCALCTERVDGTSDLCESRCPDGERTIVFALCVWRLFSLKRCPDGGRTIVIRFT